MLKTKLIHPTILKALATTGHGGKILISDGNYSHATNTNPAAEFVYLNLTPGRLTVTEVLEAILSAVPIETVEVMATDTGEEPEIYTDFRRLLPGFELKAIERFAFYDKALTHEVCLVIATGDTRLYANILLTVGVVHPT